MLIIKVTNNSTQLSLTQIKLVQLNVRLRDGGRCSSKTQVESPGQTRPCPDHATPCFSSFTLLISWNTCSYLSQWEICHWLQTDPEWAPAAVALLKEKGCASPVLARHEQSCWLIKSYLTPQVLDESFFQEYSANLHHGNLMKTTPEFVQNSANRLIKIILKSIYTCCSNSAQKGICHGFSGHSLQQNYMLEKCKRAEVQPPQLVSLGGPWWTGGWRSQRVETLRPALFLLTRTGERSFATRVVLTARPW